MAKKNTVEAARALAKVAEPTPVEIVPSGNDIIRQIADDMNHADLGDFCRLRAGIGLLNFRALNEHGNWEARMIEAFPGRSARTLRGYMQGARKFLATVDVGSEQAWITMMKVDVNDLAKTIALPDAERKMLPVKGVAKAVAIENRVMNGIVAYTANGALPPAEAPKPKRISTEQEIATRNLYARGLADKVRDWASDAKVVRTLETETLEAVMAGLVLVVDTLKSEIRSREANGVK